GAAVRAVRGAIRALGPVVTDRRGLYGGGGQPVPGVPREPPSPAPRVSPRLPAPRRPGHRRARPRRPPRERARGGAGGERDRLGAARPPSRSDGALALAPPGSARGARRAPRRAARRRVARVRTLAHSGGVRRALRA